MQHDSRNISMLMDFYEMTMAHGYFTQHENTDRVAFDVFFRRNPDRGGFAIFGGLEQIVEYILNLHFDESDIDFLRNQGIFSEEFLNYLKDFSFTGDVYAFPEGSIIYPNEPVITIVAPLIDAQIVETAVLTMMNHQSLIATKANRIVRAADGRVVADFGARRAHNAVFLVDTYDVLNSGVPNAIKVAKEVLEPMGKRLKGIRLDSGDLAYLAKKARRMLDKAGLEDCKIMASNSLDEYTITSLLGQGGPIDIFGVGERLITSKSDPVFGAVYKIAGVEKNGVWEPRIKISESVEKITNPGFKKVYRVYNDKGRAIADLLTLLEEVPDTTEPYRYIDPEQPWRELYFENCTFKEMKQLIIKDGKLIVTLPTLEELRQYVKDQLDQEIWLEEQRFENPHRHYLDMSPGYYQMKMDLLNRIFRKK